MSDFVNHFDQLYHQNSIFIPNSPQIEGLCKQQNSILLSPFNFCQSGISAVLFPKLLKISFQSKQSVNCVHQLSLMLDRSVKASLIYQRKNNVNSRIIGLAFYKDINCQYQFLNSNQQVVINWIVALSKYIHLSGFNNDFKSVKYIGRGQFGQVWQVKRLRDNNMFAAKIIDKRECFGQVNGQQSLYNQIQILRKIEHPNISKLQAIYESERNIFIILQYVEGQNLAQFIKNRNKIINQKHEKNLYKQQNTKIMKGLLKAVDYLHTNGIVHRDLKPGNIIIHRTNWTPYIIDFGLSQFIQKQNKLFQCCGSPGYIAPELFTNSKNQNIQKSDIFSLGAIFYLLFTSNPLINADSTQQIINETKNSNKIKRKINSQLQGPQKQFLQQLVNNDPQKRISAQQALNHDYFIEQMFNQLQDMRKTHQKASSSSKYSIHAKNITSKFQELFSQSIIVLQNKFKPHFQLINDKQNINGPNINLVLPSEQYNQRRKIRSKRYLSQQNIETDFPNNKIQSLNSWSGKWKNFKTLQLLFKNNNFWHFRDPNIIK